jgi:outer membrane receptor protein involved in Fe transport
MAVGLSSPVLAVMLLQAAGEIPPEPEPAPTAPVNEQLFVTGTRIQTPNRTSASPVETVRKEDFTLTGVPNVEQTLNQLPQLKPSFTNTSNNPGSGAATLDLRGLGTVRTMILVNGRRWIANDAAAVPEIDVNTIPAALIDRVDIVTGGASAVYGSDAVTGVINFVLKKRLDGLYLEANNNITEMGDGRSSSVDLSYGTGFLDGRGNFVASIGYLDQAPVFQAARDFTAFTASDSCIFKDSRDELGIGTPSVGTDCTGENEEWGLIRQGSQTVPEGVFRGGGRPILIPVGGGPMLAPNGAVHFTPDGSIERFIPALHSYNFAPDNYLQVPLERLSGHLLGSVELSKAFEPYIELSYIRTRSPQQLAPVPAVIGSGSDSVPAVTINLDNPFLSPQARQVLEISYGRDASGNPGFVGDFDNGFTVNPAFTGDADGFVTLRSPFSSRLTGLGPRIVNNERKAYRGLLGLRGELSERWSYDLYYSHSYVRHDVDFQNTASASRLHQAMLATVGPGGEIVCIDPTGGCVPINIFGRQDISNAAAEFLRISPVEQTIVEEQIAEASVHGDLWELPGGSLKTVAGATWRRTKYDYMPDRSFEDGDALGFFTTTAAGGQTTVVELFGEALIPIIKGKRFAEDLSAELGLRYSDYDSVGGVWTWKAMGNWSPIRKLRLRAGLQKAVRAPNVRELYEETATNFDFLADPCVLENGFAITPDLIAACERNGVAVLPEFGGETLVHTGGSTDLKAETARTLTIGAVMQPFPWIEATVDYYDIDIKDIIGVFGGGANSTVIGCIYGGADPADPLCQAYERDADGLVSDVFAPTANLARLRARGIDWQVATRFSLAGGRATVNFSGTRLIAWDDQINHNLNPVLLAGTFSTPKWKLFNQLSWSRNPVTFNLRHRYFSSMDDPAFAQAEALDQPSPTNVPVHAAKMQSRHYFDAAVNFAFGRRFELTLGVNNLTDAKPSLVGFGQVQANTDPSLYDMLGRRYFASISAKIQ